MELKELHGSIEHAERVEYGEGGWGGSAWVVVKGGWVY